METVEQYKKQQIKNVEILRRLLEFIREGKKFGIQDSDNLVSKITSGIDEIKSEKLKVALIGGFSEGKTSIAAAWSGNYDSATMKIDAAESSDEVQVYHLENFDLIDTPGLFGFKQTVNQVKYKEITRNYISEANLLLYVMNPSNPIKDSHKEELEWLFNDLKLLSRTIFVISRFDEEVDIEDQVEYEESFKIKKENVTNRLRDFGIITENQEVPIVAISANPFGEGFNYWLSNIDEYNQISHINDLQVATSNKIKDFGGKNALVLETGKSIVEDVIQRQIPIVQKTLLSLIDENSNLKKAIEEMGKEKNKIENDISSVSVELKEFIVDLFTSLILKAKGTDLKTIDSFLEKNIGDNGIVLETEIQSEFERQLGKIAFGISKAETSFDANINHYNNMVGDLTIKGVKLSEKLLKSKKITELSNKTVLSTRNFLMPSFKFKPWGATKLAKGVKNSSLVLIDLIDVGLEIWDSYSQAKQQKEFQKAKEKIVDNLNLQRKDYIDFINNKQEFIEQFFPNYLDLLNRISQLEEESVKKENNQCEFKDWVNEGKTIEADFKVIS